MKSNMEIALEKIVASGTKIVSFKYNDRVRNVLVGSNLAGTGVPTWGHQANRALRVHDGKTYLVGLCMNEGRAGVVKTFALDKIQNPSFA
jgi:hypothetical protein